MDCPNSKRQQLAVNGRRNMEEDSVEFGKKLLATYPSLDNKTPSTTHIPLTPAINSTELVKDMIAVDLIKVGQFKLKCGRETPIYIDLREVTLHPNLCKTLVTLISLKVKDICINNPQSDAVIGVTGVPYGAVPMASIVAYLTDLPYYPVRKETKDYGRKADHFNCDILKIILIEDVISSGSSLIETIHKIGSKTVSDIVVVVDRELGGLEALRKEFPEIKVHSLCKMSDIMKAFDTKQ